MSNFRRLVSNLGWDGWTLFVCGIAAIIIALLDFTAVLNIGVDDTLKMILVGIGLILTAIVAQSSRRRSEIEELQSTINASHIELLGMRDLGLHVRQNIREAKRYVLDTTLNAERANLSHPSDQPDQGYYHALFERLQKTDFSYRKVEVIYNKERLEYVLSRLLILEGTRYFVRYYDAPPKAIPTLNVLSIDNELFYLGGFDTSDAPMEHQNTAIVQDKKLGELLSAYWNNLWFNAIPLNEGGRINWDELKSIATRFGLSNTEFDAMANKWKEESIRRKRRSR